MGKGKGMREKLEEIGNRTAFENVYPENFRRRLVGLQPPTLNSGDFFRRDSSLIYLPWSSCIALTLLMV